MIYFFSEDISMMLVIIGVVLLVIFLLCLRQHHRNDGSSGDKFVHLPFNKPNSMVLKKITSNRYMQNMPPSLNVENNYHDLVMKECAGNYDDFNCLQKVYVKTMKNGTTDRADLVCSRYTNEDDRYSCMDAVYGNYLWMDRATNNASVCNCGRHVGLVKPDGSCMCPTDVNLNDRSPRDIDWVAQPMYKVRPSELL